MEQKKDLTNEKLKFRFKSQFELVNYAIRLAENMVRTGRDARVKTDLHSKAFQILAEIKANKDSFEEEIIEKLEEIPREINSKE